MNNPDEALVFCERTTRDEDARAGALALAERDEIALLSADRPFAATLEFIQELLREVTRHAPRFDWTVCEPAVCGASGDPARSLSVVGTAGDGPLRNKTIRLLLLDTFGPPSADFTFSLSGDNARAALPSVE